MTSILTHDSSGRSRSTPRTALLAAAALVLVVGWGLRGSSQAAEDSRVVPAPVTDEAAAAGGTETAVVAGGCFWGVQGVFQHVKGVANAVSGYAGGARDTAAYDQVSTGETGHAESVKITFDPRQISYGRILQIYFSVAHDPTELNRQGPDSGTQYRSAIFPADGEQARVAQAYVRQLNDAHAFGAPVVTRIEPGKTFYPAEAHHQDFLARNPNYPYIAYNDLPKVEDLHRLFPDRYRTDPVLVAAAPPTN